MPGLGDVALDEDLVVPLELLEDEGAHDAVTHDEREQADVREEEAAKGKYSNLRLVRGTWDWKKSAL